MKNDYPILFDGLHTTFCINHPALSNRKKLVRVHNIEHRYYQSQANHEPNLIKKLYFLIEYPCIIAGKNPPAHILSDTSLYSNIRVISNPDYDEMTTLILNAHIHLLPAMVSDGFKIKLLLALFTGRHCPVNSKMAEGTYTGELCQIADSKKEIVDKIHYNQV